jgi:hypothetical protein
MPITAEQLEAARRLVRLLPDEHRDIIDRLLSFLDQGAIVGSLGERTRDALRIGTARSNTPSTRLSTSSPS